MGKLILAAIVAVGIGFIGTSGASAAPANGVTINDSAIVANPIVKVQHWLAQPPLAALPLSPLEPLGLLLNRGAGRSKDGPGGKRPAPSF